MCTPASYQVFKSTALIVERACLFRSRAYLAIVLRTEGISRNTFCVRLAGTRDSFSLSEEHGVTYWIPIDSDPFLSRYELSEQLLSLFST